MVYDFSKICNTYDAKIYKKSDFASTRCPKCLAIGRFNLHGSYQRYVLYFEDENLLDKYIEIKRIKCRSCKTTHAVMPGDIIPYKVLSLLIILLILIHYHIAKIPVLKIAAEWDFSFQFIYDTLTAYQDHATWIYQYFRETSWETETMQTNIDDAGIIFLIKKPYTDFQSGYIKLNKRPCFMCKFFNSPKAPTVGQMHHILPFKGQQHNL
ncbi:MAG: DUF6431 domain-containing protein [Oscillospiraceae bacterium]|jgi:hypothetical protein|nr:DUF6431 domain-containing protein [Oscillospiraceae bacterium]